MTTDKSALLVQQAKRLLSLPGSAPHLAEAALEAAMEDGDGEAAMLLAALAASGCGKPPDWPKALNLLRLGAANGWPLAQRQMALLAPHGGEVDVSAWLTVPAKHVVSESPRIRSIAHFLAPEICDWLKERAAPMLAPAVVFDYSGSAATAARESGRTNSESTFGLLELDLILLLLRERIATATGLSSAAMEATKVFHYAPGQSFERHFDFIETGEPAGAAQVAEEGQRLATFLVYLNDDFDGGETDFPLIPYRHRARRGDALYFANVDSQGQVDRLTLHAGLPPRGGEKWILSQWVRDRARVF